MFNRNKKMKYSAAKLSALRMVEGIAVVVILVIVLFTQVFGVARVSGVSMENTFHDGEAVFLFRLVGEYQRGDVVRVKMTNGDNYIKRVVAVPGDTVEFADGKLIRNGETIEESYALGETWPVSGGEEYPLTLSEGQYFVLGDNREESVDSRSFGPVVKAQIKGRIIN